MASNVVQMVLKIKDGATPTLEKVSDATNKTGKEVKQTSTRFTEFNSKLNLAIIAAKAAVVAFKAVAVPFANLAKESVKTGAQMEKFGSQLKILMGDAGAAQERLDELFKIGTTTPFQLEGLIEAEVNLRTLGVEAERVLPMVMDFAGTMQTDLASAAVEVGRAMQFGAGAVRSMGGRALATQVKIRTGMDPLKMSIKEFREELELALTDPKGMFKGGTQELASTFSGMVSNLQDAWFKFTKQISEEGAFDVAKETLRVMLELIDDNQDGLTIMARVISEGIVKGLLGAVEMTGILADSFIAVTGAIVDLSKKWTEMVLSMGTTGVVGPILMTDKEEANLRARLATLTDTKEVLQDMGGFTTMAQEAVSTIEARVAALPKRRKRAGTVRKIDPIRELSETLDDGKPAEAGKQFENMASTLKNIEQGIQEQVGELRQLPHDVALAMLDSVTGPLLKPTETLRNSLSKSLGPGGTLIGAFADIGAQNPKQIAKEFAGFFKNIVRAFTTVLPELIVMIPQVLIESLPQVLGGLLKALPKLIGSVVFKLPAMLIKVFGRWLVKSIGGFFDVFINDLPSKFVKGLRRWFKGALRKIRDIFKPGKIFRPETKAGRRRLAVATFGVSEVFRGVRKIAGKKHSGGFIGMDGLFNLQKGERVIPNSGIGPQTIEAAGNIGGGQVINIHTNVVDPNSIRQLGLLLNREFGSKGRSRGVSIFNSLDRLAGAM